MNCKTQIVFPFIVCVLAFHCSVKPSSSRTDASQFSGGNADSEIQKQSAERESGVNTFFLLSTQVEMLNSTLPDTYKGNFFPALNEYMTYRYPITANELTEENLIDSFSWLVGSSVLLLQSKSSCVAPPALDSWTRTKHQPAYILCKNPVAAVPASCQVSPLCAPEDEVCLVGCSAGAKDAFSEPSKKSSNQLTLLEERCPGCLPLDPNPTRPAAPVQQFICPSQNGRQPPERIGGIRADSHDRALSGVRECTRIRDQQNQTRPQDNQRPFLETAAGGRSPQGGETPNAGSENGNGENGGGGGNADTHQIDPASLSSHQGPVQQTTVPESEIAPRPPVKCLEKTKKADCDVQECVWSEASISAPGVCMLKVNQ